MIEEVKKGQKSMIIRFRKSIEAGIINPDDKLGYVLGYKLHRKLDYISLENGRLSIGRIFPETHENIVGVVEINKWNK